tara:strand:- start:20 stop:790 length:771 start_codon:yes stop_codon:yes gene_type:complete
MKQTLALITGAGTGIGNGTAHALLARGVDVLAVGRRRELLAQLQQQYPSQVFIVDTDITTAEGREKIVAHLPDTHTLGYLIHNATTVKPLGPLLDAELNDWRYHMAVNVEAPIFLTKALLPHLAKQARLLFVGSRAKDQYLLDTGTYCVSKAALHRVYEVLKEELPDYAVGHIHPGGVKSESNMAYREHMAARLPQRDFKQRIPVETVGAFISWLLLEATPEQFSENHININDEWHHAFWADGLSFIENNTDAPLP